MRQKGHGLDNHNQESTLKYRRTDATAPKNQAHSTGKIMEAWSNFRMTKQ